MPKYHVQNIIFLSMAHAMPEDIERLQLSNNLVTMFTPTDPEAGVFVYVSPDPLIDNQFSESFHKLYKWAQENELKFFCLHRDISYNSELPIIN